MEPRSHGVGGNAPPYAGNAETMLSMPIELVGTAIDLGLVSSVMVNALLRNQMLYIYSLEHW
jgi:hypothetical protein